MVPANWQHPKDGDGGYIAQFYEDYDTAAKEWIMEFTAWQGGVYKGKPVKPDWPKYFWDWDGMPPDKDSYRRAWLPDETPDHFQIYETVSEGTPVSPVFASRDELAAWLVTQGHSVKAAKAFANDGWAPSMVVNRTNGSVSVKVGIDALDDLP